MVLRPEISGARINLICDSQARIDRAIAHLEKAALIANDVETHPYRRIIKHVTTEQFALTVCAFACESGDFVFPLQNSKSPASGAPVAVDAIVRAITHINALPIPHVGHNFSYDVQWYLRYGMPIRNWAFDTMVMFWSLWPDMPKSLSFVASILLDDHQYWKQGRKNDNWLEFLSYAGKDVWATLRICKILLEHFTHDSDPTDEIAGSRRNFIHGMLRCYAAVGMNCYGSYIDEGAMQEIEIALHAEADEALTRLRYLVADDKFNPRSPAQMKKLLYGILGAKPRGAKGRAVSDVAKASTGQIVQRLIKQDGLIQRRVIQAIENTSVPAKQISNVINMPQFPTQRGSRRFLTFFDGVGTMTTRFASRGSSFGHGGNAQNIRKAYRRFMRADPGGFLLEADFSGADGVFVAFESEEEVMIRAFREGLDIHAMTGSVLFAQWTYDAIVAGKKAGDTAIVHPIYGIRQIAKKVGHGCNYLMAGMTLLMTATVPTVVSAAIANGHADAGTWTLQRLAAYCTELEQLYRAGYPRLKRDAWYADIMKGVRATGSVTTIYGFTLPISGSPEDDATVRLVAAAYGQASTAGRTNAALYELEHGIRTVRFRDGEPSDAKEPPLRITMREHGTRIVRQTHDSLTFHGTANHPGLREGLNRIFHVMRRPFVCKGREFALGVDTDVSRNWAHGAQEVRDVDSTMRWIDENRNFLHEV